MVYRAELDGLRALAVVSVILYHADYALFSGGYIGVDIFFVISGYLITCIILEDLQRNEFSLRAFYQRRARRILPALFLVTLLTFPAFWLWLPPDEMNDYAESVVALLFFSSNFLFWLESGYFEISNAFKPLIHTWSLAVEEQFYLLYPLLLLSLWRLGLKRVVITLCTIFLASLVYAEWASVFQPSAAFYLLPARAWQLLIGGLAAIFLGSGKKIDVSIALADRMSFAGLALIAYAVLVFDEFTPVQGLTLLIPVIGALLIIVYGSSSSSAQKILCHPALVHIGLISYSAYLWHQPLLAFARNYFVAGVDPRIIAALVLLTFPLAHLSWKYIEQPFRQGNRNPHNQPLRYLLLPVLALLSLGLYGTSDEVQQNRFVQVEREMATYFDPDVDAREDESPCFFRDTIEDEKLQDCLNNVAGEKFAVLVGDSHAAAQSFYLRQKLLGENYGLISIVKNGCPPVPGLMEFSPDASQSCAEFMQRAYDRVSTLGDVFTVVSAYWVHYLRNIYDKSNSEPLNLLRNRDNFTQAIEPDPHAYEMALDFMAMQIGGLASQQQLVVVGPIPEASGRPNARIRSYLMRRMRDFEISTSHEDYRRLGARFDELASLLPSEVVIVLPEELVCSRQVPGRCENVRNGKSLYRDQDHPTGSFAELIATEIVMQVVNGKDQ